MIVRDIHVEYASINGFSSLEIDKVRHIKVLPYLSVVQAVEGDYDITLGNGIPHNTADGGFFVAPANIQQTIVHNADRNTKRMTCRWVFMKVKLNGVHYLDDVYRLPVILPSAVKTEMNAVFDTLFASTEIAEQYVCYYRIVRLLLSVAQEKDHRLPPYIAQATTYIESHYREKITVDDIASQVNLSSSRFFAVFKKQTGISPIAYLNNYRLSLAVELLTTTDMTVAQAAAAVGIEDAVYFNKIFKKSYQLSPTAYRRQYRAKGSEE